MLVKANFYLVNEDFSIEHAKEHHGGEASENNIQFHWEDQLEIKNEISTIKPNKNATYHLKGYLEKNEPFDFEIKNMLRIDLIGNDNSITHLAFSESIFHSFDIEEIGDTTSINVYLKDYEVFANPIPGVYIDVKDFPKALAK